MHGRRIVVGLQIVVTAAVRRIDLSGTLADGPGPFVREGAPGHPIFDSLL